MAGVIPEGSHIVDMHQLTKDPEAILMGAPPTASSPQRTLGEMELRRYLDCSCELLALVGKVAALYAEGLADLVILDAVDDLEDLTAGLIGKIWQKLVIMDRWKVIDWPEVRPSYACLVIPRPPVSIAAEPTCW
jgi:hypothetical protein